MEKFGFSFRGPRKNNEDYYGFEQINGSHVFCVADGVGGNACGEFASKFSVQRFLEIIKISQIVNLKTIIDEINKELIGEAVQKQECKGMATTFTGLYINERSAQFIHTGDSRIYLLRGNGVIQLTEDHTEVRRLLNEGLLSREARLGIIQERMLLKVL